MAWVFSAAQTAPLARQGGGGQPRLAAPSKGQEVTPLAPFWRDFRLQIGRMEGLRGLPIPPSLQRCKSADPPVSVRCGAFNSDRLRLGRFIFITLEGERAILLGALFPTIHSRHPPFIFELAALGAAGWMVSFDCPPLFQAASSTADGLNESNAAAREAALYSKLEAIKHECGSLVVPLPEQFLAQQRWMSRSACLLSSTQLGPRQGEEHGRRVKGKATSVKFMEALHGPALKAFSAALSCHLNALVAAPLDASPAAVVEVVAAHDAMAAEFSRREFLGCELLEGAFGPAWMAQLRAGVLDDAYGLHKWRSMSGGDGTPSNEFYYFNPNRLR